MKEYFLMHKDQICGKLWFDEDSGRIAKYSGDNNNMSPFLGTANLKKISVWWKMRAVPGTRNLIRQIMKESGCVSPENYLEKNLAISISDTYWICPADSDLSFDKIQFSNLASHGDGRVPYHNESSFDPNASLGGEMEKYWDLRGDVPQLVKESRSYFGQQALNEAFSCYIHRLQDSDTPFVEYKTYSLDENSAVCKCNAFTSKDIELVSAYEIIESRKHRNDIALYDEYVDICVENGIDRETIQNFMDYQTLSDFVISNTDRHLNNFGILRDANTMEFIAPAPIFDSGNSMFYNESRKSAYTRAEILEKRITSFYHSEEKMLQKVKNKNILKEDLLPDPKSVKEIYANSGIPEWKAEVISRNYATKISLLHEFQKGKTISYYHEKQIERKNASMSSQFIMICGIPGSGKTVEANKICEDFVQQGYISKDSKKLFPIEKVMGSNPILTSCKVRQEDLPVLPEYRHSVVVISANAIRKEFEEKYGYYENDQVFAVVDNRIFSALQNKAIVIYDASNLDKDTRIHYINLAKDAGSSINQLYVCRISPSMSSSDIGMDKLISMYNRLEYSHPNDREGWTGVNFLERTRQIEETEL